MRLSDLICPQAILPELSATDRDATIEELVASLVAAEKVPAEAHDQLVQAIVDRERKGSTGFGKGVAVPHAKHPLVPEMVAAVGVSRTGLDFNSLDSQPVYSVVLLLSPADQSQEHLDAMQTIFKRLQQDQFRRFLRQARDQTAVIDLIEETDEPA